MEWLSQNWVWFALFAGMMWLCGRGHRGASMGGCCGHRGAREGPADQTKAGGGEDSRVSAAEESPDQGAAPVPAARRGGHAGCH